jgi:hypothetical protein
MNRGHPMQPTAPMDHQEPIHNDVRMDSEDIIQQSHIQSSAYPPPGGPYGQGSANNYVYVNQGFQPSGVDFAQSAAAVTGQKRRAEAGSSQGFDFESPARNYKKRRTAPDSGRGRPRKKRPDEAILAPPTAVPQYQYPDLPSQPPSEPFEPDFEALARKSREIAIATKKPKEPQTRTPWSRNDVRALVRAVDVYKAKWSKIEEQIRLGHIAFEHPRDQQALRDKARLLKQDFLK